MLGAPRGIVLSPEDRERTAYHESGHALVGMLTAGRRPGPQDLDHPARHGARRHALDARRRPGLLLARGPRGEDPGRARRARGRGGRLRQDHHRRRVRHPAADPDRAADGRALGDERQDRTDRGAAQPTARARSCPAPARPPPRPSGSSTRRSSRIVDDGPRRGHALLTEHRDAARQPRAARCSRPRRSTRIDAYAAAGVPMRAAEITPELGATVPTADRDSGAGASHARRAGTRDRPLDLRLRQRHRRSLCHELGELLRSECIRQRAS